VGGGGLSKRGEKGGEKRRILQKQERGKPKENRKKQNTKKKQNPFAIGKLQPHGTRNPPNEKKEASGVGKGKGGKKSDNPGSLVKKRRGEELGAVPSIKREQKRERKPLKNWSSHQGVDVKTVLDPLITPEELAGASSVLRLGGKKKKNQVHLARKFSGRKEGQKGRQMGVTEETCTESRRKNGEKTRVSLEPDPQ